MKWIISILRLEFKISKCNGVYDVIVNFFKKIRVKDIFSICSLKTLFFGTSVSFWFTYGTLVLEKS
jgi:hypothetical protein